VKRSRAMNRFVQNGTANFGQTNKFKVDHLKKWSRIFLSEGTGTDLSI